MNKYLKYKRKYLNLKYKMKGGQNKRVLVLCQRREYNDMTDSPKESRKSVFSDIMTDSPKHSKKSLFDDMSDSPRLFENNRFNVSHMSNHTKNFDDKTDDFIMPRKISKEEKIHNNINTKIQQYAERILSSDVKLEFLSCTCGNSHISCDNNKHKECSGVDYYFEFDPTNIQTREFLEKNREQYSMIILYTCPKALMLGNENMLQAFNMLLESEGKLALLSFDNVSFDNVSFDNVSFDNVSFDNSIKETIEHINSTFPYEPTKTQELYSIISKYFTISNILTKNIIR